MKPVTRTAQEWGAIGGSIGGRRRADKLSPKRKSEIARMGAIAMHAIKRNKARNGKRAKAA